MEEKNRKNMGEPRYEYYEDEINLFDYFLVLWKWKWLIFSGTLLVVIIALVITLQMPESYTISMDIEPGVIGLDDKGNKLYMDSKEIIGKIQGGKYNGEIGKSLSKLPASSSLAFTAQADKYSNLITVGSQWTKGDLDIGLEASRKLSLLLIEDHEEVIEQRKKEIDDFIAIEGEKIETAEKTMEDAIKKEVRSYSNKIDFIHGKRELEEQLLELIKIRQTDLVAELGKTRNALEYMVAQRDTLLKKSGSEASGFLPEYEAAIRTWQLRKGQIEEKIFAAKVKEREILSGIRTADLEIKSHRQAIKDSETEQKNQLQKQLTTIREGIEKLSVMRAGIGNIRVFRQPETSPTPVKSSKGKKIILLSGVVALFMFIFLAFFIEYIKNARREYLSGKEKV
ncbi:MAG: hypothetical protein JXB42_00700 [Deltaproteobacteria bacterium]|nr:hypothetical protein [Deltaproteobacteria bacterium]